MPNGIEQMIEQTQKERDLAYMDSTEELLRDVLESQNIPYDIYSVAIFSLINKFNWNRAENVSDFMNKMELFITLFDASVPIYMNDKISKTLTASKGDIERLVKLLTVLTVGPEAIKLKDGKVVL